MNTLQSNMLLNLISEHSSIKKIIESLEKESLPKEIEGLKGSLYAYFITAYIKKHAKSVVVVLPNETDVQSCLNDFDSIYADTPSHQRPQVFTLPW